MCGDVRSNTFEMLNVVLKMNFYKKATLKILKNISFGAEKEKKEPIFSVKLAGKS